MNAGLQLNLRLARCWRSLGEVPREAAQALRANASFDLERIQEIEREVKHDVIAFTTAVSESMKAQGRGRSFALAALWADVERCGGYGARVADQECLGDFDEGFGSTAGGVA